MNIVLIQTVWLWCNASEGYISKSWGKALYPSAKIILCVLGNFDTSLFIRDCVERTTCPRQQRQI